MEMLTLDIMPEDWGNLVSKYPSDSAKVSPSEFTAGTANIDTDVNGNITKRKGGPNYNPTLLATAPKDQYEAIFSDGTRHLLVVANGEIKYSTGDTVFNTVVNGSGFSAGANFEFATTQDRVYGDNGVAAPQVYDKTTSYGGVAYSAPRMKAMGAQAPGSAPTAAVGAAGNVPAGSYTYKVTFLYYDSEESNGSPASTAVVPGVASQINLTSIPIGGYGVTARKIYRSSGPDWLNVGTISNNTATVFTDNSAAGTTLIPDDNGVPPTFALIVSWLGRLWVAKITGEPYTIVYSDANLPDIFPADNFVLCNEQDPITGLVVYLDRIVVFNRKTMGQILGLSSDSFRYSDIQGSVGCVDNRSIQVRVVNGVPLLIWLSDRGFYSYDGNSVEYISDPIEDLVNFNIQQAIQQRNSQIQTTQSDFTAGSTVAGTAIDLTTVPDQITTINPKRSFSTQADWEGGLTKTNLVTKAGDPLKAPVRFVPSVQQGTFSTAFYDASYSGIKLPTFSLGNQWQVSSNQQAGLTEKYDEMVFKIVSPRAGTLTTFNMGLVINRAGAGDPSTANLDFRVYSDNSGAPGSVLHTQSTSVGGLGIGNNNISTFVTLNYSIGASTYWLGIKITNASSTFYGQGSLNNSSTFNQSPNGTTAFPGIVRIKRSTAVGTFMDYSPAVRNTGGTITYESCNVLITYVSTASVGQWISTVYDSQSIYVSGTMSLVQDISTQSNPSVASVQSYVEGSNDQSSWTIVRTAPSNLDGTDTFAGSAFRYWRIRSTLSTNNDVYTQYQPILYSVQLRFPTTAIWISNGIDLTSEVTAYNSLDAVSSIPGGTSLAIEVATSTDDISYSSFGPIGSATVQRYLRIRVTFTTDAANSTTPVLTSLLLKWTVVASLTSSAINTGITPSGWDVFQITFTGNVTVYMRSGASPAALSAATFYQVTNGNFPPITVLPLQYTQWKVVLTSVADSLPTVSDVTVNWFIGTPSSIRTASIFVDGRYFLAAAELGETFNNILIMLDLNFKWRIYRGLSVATFSYFFNRPYLGLSTTGQIRKFLDGKTDAGSAIEVDVRTKAVDYSTKYKDVAEKEKIPHEVILMVTGTGATFQLYFSLDEGETFTLMQTNLGSTSYTSTTDGRTNSIRFKPNFTSNISTGKTIMYRVYSNDLNDVEIIGLKTKAFVREGDPVITG